MNEQWKQLKDTIVEIRDHNEFENEDVTLMCRFLVNYMDILEKQMQQPCEDCISRTEVIKSIDEREDVNGKVDAESVRTDIVLIPHINPQPCEDAISRQAALNALYALCDMGETLKENPWRDNPHIDAVVEAIEELPSVTPQPKTGHWIRWYEQKETEWYTECIPHCKCSECGKEYDTYSSQFIKYCPNCGAKMVESQEREGCEPQERSGEE